MAPKSTTLKNALATAIQQVRHYSAPADGLVLKAKKYVPSSGTYPKGFLAGTSHAGVKASNTSKDDITMVVSEVPCAASAVFTQNVFKAAPVTTSKATLTRMQNTGVRGVVVNSGCANAVTGKLGLDHARAMARTTDQCFGENHPNTQPQTLVMSTGVIGQRLPIDKIAAAIPKAHAALGNTHDHWLKAAEAICTTDTFPKLLSRTFTLPSHPETTYSLAGMTKGAGMIHPNMATLLGIVCTDAKIAPGAMTTFLRYATNRTFNCITIDGDTSTNDTVAFFANGAAAPEGAEAIDVPKLTHYEAPKGRPVMRRNNADSSADAVAFREVLTTFMRDLASLVVRDGEGATKFVTIRVVSDVGYLTARRAAMSIARSSLVKTALYGKDANWGRILCAIGYAPGIMSAIELQAPAMTNGLVQVVPERTSVSFSPADGSEELKLLVRGEPEQVDEARAKVILEMEDLEILVRLEDGELKREHERPDASVEAVKRERQRHEAVVWTCDFSHEYVTINGDYRT